MRNAFTLLCLLSSAALAAEEPLDVGSRRQLFIDRRFIARSERITLAMNPARKVGLLRDEKGEALTGHVSRVIDHDGVVRLYVGAEDVVIYESRDGLAFKRAGAIRGGIFPTIFLDPHDPDPARRWKLFRLRTKQPFDRETDGIHAAWSADGVNFTEAGRVLPFYTDNPTIVVWDARIGKYVIYVRALAYNSENQRRIGRIETDDPLKPWPFTKSPDDTRTLPFLSTGNIPVILQADDEDDPHSDMYYNAATLYPGAQDVYLMFPALFRHFSPQRNPFIRPRQPGQWEDYGMLEVQCAVSRDGIRWERPSREPYVEGGLPDEWDRWNDVMAPGIVRRGNSLYQYYGSSGRLHDSVILRPEYDEAAKQVGGVGVVQQRVDGFVSVNVDHKGGWLETPLLRFDGARLRLNIDTGAMGTAFIELRDADNRPIPGFTLSDCEEIGGNFLDQQVYWKGNPDLSSLRGRPVRIHFRLKRAKLYAFEFGK